MNVEFLNFMENVVEELRRQGGASNLIESAKKLLLKEKKNLAEQKIINMTKAGHQMVSIETDKGWETAWFHAWGSIHGEPCAICEDEYGSIVLVRTKFIKFIR